jgi:L-alanine-DL-glutamate epimerase-like enolase superfamily enzyme
MQIADVALYWVTGEMPDAGFPPGNRQARMLDVYPEFNQPHVPRPGPRRLREIYVEITADNGTAGLFGPIDETQAFVIDRHLRSFLLGRDPLATEALLDQMLRLHRHGRSGLYMTGISAVDCALWDLKGKVLDLPVYRLLGGPTRGKVPAYASMLGFSTDPDRVGDVAGAYRELGYSAQKWFFRYGPGDGKEGMASNIAMARAVRDAVGDDYSLMFDAFMGWDTAYASEMVRALDPINPRWVEEPIPPERVGAFRRIRQASSVPLATGEHVYTRWQARELLASEAVDVLQTDPDWTGGITELTKVCALASAFDVPVIAHGHSLLAALHVAGAQSPNTVPYVEYLVRSQPGKQFFHSPTYEPVGGAICLPELPGLGLVLDMNKVLEREPVRFGVDR